MQLPLIAYVCLASNALPLGAGALWWKALGRPMRLLVVYVAIGATVEATTWVLAFSGMKTLWIFHIYTLFELAFLGAILRAFPEMAPFRKSIAIAVAAYALYWLASKIFIESFSGFDTYSSPPANIILVILGLTALHSSGRAVEAASWETPLFWIGVAVLVKFAGDLTTFAFGDWLTGLSVAAGIEVWSIHWYLGLLYNIFLAIAFACRPRNPEHTGSS